jgi:prepilin-type N-terminal cleavage/methylation domain-containing protein
MVIRKNHTESGFTLLEVIVTIVVVASIAAMMAAYFSTAYTQSSNQFSRLNAMSGLSGVMEKISAQYTQYPHWRPNTTYPANAIVLPTTANRTGMLYQTSAGGTSGATEPNWLSTSIIDNTVTWVPSINVNGTQTPMAAPTLVLQNWVASQTYQSHATIVHNGYVYVITSVPSGGGVSGASAPTFPTTPVGQTVNDGSGLSEFTWTLSGGPVTVSTTLPTSPLQLQTEIGPEGTNQTNTVDNWGNYSVIENRFIKFNASNTEQNINTTTSDPLYGWYLKVTIGDPTGTGQTVSTLFVLR